MCCFEFKYYRCTVTSLLVFKNKLIIWRKVACSLPRSCWRAVWFHLYPLYIKPRRPWMNECAVFNENHLDVCINRRMDKLTVQQTCNNLWKKEIYLQKIGENQIYGYIFENINCTDIFSQLVCIVFSFSLYFLQLLRFLRCLD